MDLPYRAHNLEIRPLKLTDQQFPLQCSLKDQVLGNYAASAAATGDSQMVMEADEVLVQLRQIEEFKLSPVDAIRAQGTLGDPRMPEPSLMAILQWVQDAFALWEEGFPIEEPVGTQLRQLVPAAAAAAISDEEFFVPGAHPLHQLIDTLHSSAIGWQPLLGRAGLALEQLVNTAIEDLGTWLNEDGVDLKTLCEDLITKAKKDHDRAQRMTQRLVETEKGKFKTASARWKSAQMINLALEDHQATPEIGDFLRGPWYESAQLVLLKFGADSNEWAKMSDTTLALLESLQIDESVDEDKRQHLFEAVTKLPKEIKRWLLSLHMDPEGVSEAVGLIELTHLHLLRQQAVTLTTIEPLPMEGMTPYRIDGEELQTIEALETGQWFLVDSGLGEYLRVQLVLKLDQEQLLQFTNRAGIKAMEQGYADFCALLNSGAATPLRSGASFSSCLANAAGVWTEEEAQRIQTEQLESNLESHSESAEKVEANSEERDPQELTDTEFQDSGDTESDPAIDPVEASSEESQAQDEDSAKETSAAEDAEDDEIELEAVTTISPESPEAEPTPQERVSIEAQEITIEIEPAEPETEIIIPMGTWLGFHDGDAPLMAKLAVHDLEQDSYIFVNRQGIKMRSLNMREMITLMDNDQVEILEARSNFRSEVTRVKKQED
ncbi:MAG: DUF1631 family protein [Halioglobus sp.]